MIDSLQVAHITLLRAVLQEPDAKWAGGITGSFMQTLGRRVPGLSEERIENLVAQLNDYRVLNMGSLKTMMTARGAEYIRHVLTPFGQRLVAFLREEPRGGPA